MAITKDFKAANAAMVHEGELAWNKQKEILSRELYVKKKNQMKILEMTKYNMQNENFIGWSQ